MLIKQASVLFFFPSVFIKQHPAFTKVHRSGTAEDNCAYVCICMLADRCLPAEIMNARTRMRAQSVAFLEFSTVLPPRMCQSVFSCKHDKHVRHIGVPHLEPSSLIELMYKWTWSSLTSH